MLSRAAFNAARLLSNALFGANLYERSSVARSIYEGMQSLHRRLHPSHRAFRRFRAINPLQPWFVPEAVAFLETLIHPGMTAFEWGSGASTVWLALHGLSVVTIERDAKWRDWVDVTAKRRCVQHLIDICLTDAGPDGYAQVLRSLNRQFDIIVVDGAYRAECLCELDSFAGEAIIVVDDAARADLAPSLASWRDRLIRSFDNGISRTNFYRARQRG